MGKRKKKEKSNFHIEVIKKTESVLDSHERRLMDLISGKEPKNESEARMVEQIKKIEESGRIIDIPSSL